MTRTLIDGINSILSNSIIRSLINTTTAGSSLITKVLPGSGINITSTGVDNGTGDVTISSTLFSSWASYTPTITVTGGTNVTTANVSGSYFLLGKTLYIKANVTVSFTTVLVAYPTAVTFSIPSGITGNGINVVSGANVSSGSDLSAYSSNNSTTVVCTGYQGLSNTPFTASAQTIAFNGILLVQ